MRHSDLASGRLSMKSIAELRAELAKRFPSVTRPLGRVLPVGIPAIDEAAGGLPLGAVTEIVCSVPSGGSHLLLGQLLAVTRSSRARVALVDSTDSFDPVSFPADQLAHLIWVRCAGTTPALNAADLLTRDANLGLVVLDLRRAPLADLRRIPGPQWYRLQRAVEPSELALVVVTPAASVPSAQLRFMLERSHSTGAFDHERPVIMAELTPVLHRQRVTSAVG
jgi:hypothetical protein